MSLNFDLSQTALPRDDRGALLWTTATDPLIWYTMSVGMGSITDANAGEFYARLQILELLWGSRPEHRINAADVRQHIGLTTNVSTRSRAVWLREQVGRRVDEDRRAFADRADTDTPRPQIRSVAGPAAYEEALAVEVDRSHARALKENEGTVMVHPDDVHWYRDIPFDPKHPAAYHVAVRDADYSKAAYVTRYNAERDAYLAAHQNH